MPVDKYDDIDELYDNVRSGIIDMLFEYDRSIKQKYEGIIELAKMYDSELPIPQRMLKERDPRDSEKQHEYFTSPQFKRAVDSLTGFVIDSIVKGKMK